MSELDPDVRRRAAVKRFAASSSAKPTPLEDLPFRLEGMPVELLNLNRFGIGIRSLFAAWKLSQKYNVAPREILLRTGTITEEIWQSSLRLLEKERQNVAVRSLEKQFLLDTSINRLFRERPDYSAKHTFTPTQLAGVIVLMGLLAVFLLVQPRTALFAIMGVLFVFYFLNIIMRICLLAGFDRRNERHTLPVHVSDEALPTYTVLVALYKEPGQVPALIRNLEQLCWPASKLDIKLVCEADDLPTISAIRDANPASHFQTVLVPPAHPRTKPKALNYALPSARGDYLVLYDAEDCPDPQQLREAYVRFLTSPPDVACLQAPLHIHIAGNNWLCSMFAIEYYTLFNGILPVLAKWRLPLPLGGTSNHFKTSVLRKVGAWDPHNVTEDADLGIRLFREGYRSETLISPTYEEAPSLSGPWIRQRTRWIKGWMQTILVHSRRPLCFVQEVGLRNALAFHLFLSSTVLSVLIHPVFLALLIWQLISLPAFSSPEVAAVLLGSSVFNLVGGYSSYGLLALVTLKAKSATTNRLLLLTLPFYWIMISMAGWRAFVHLIVKPHYWEKTPHGLTNATIGTNSLGGPV